jgi:hypothetical protein
MATVFRQDTGELLGYLTEPEGPFPGGITYWPFKAWVHSDAKLRSEPEPGTDETTPAVTCLYGITTAATSSLILIGRGCHIV